MQKTWHFYAVRASNRFGYAWHWRSIRTDGTVAQCETAFDYYYDCVEHARKHGFRGRYPTGPSVALPRLPDVVPKRPALRMVIERVACAPVEPAQC